MQKRGSTRRGRIAAIALAIPAPLIACLVAERARASDPPPVTLEWHGPDDCQAAPRVLAEVRRLLGGERAGSSLVAHAKVGRAGRRWHLVLTTERAGHATSRQIDAESCGAAADATAVILALTIDPSRGLEGDDDASAPPPPPPPAEASLPEGRDAGAAIESDAGGPEAVLPEAPEPAEVEDAGGLPVFPLFLIAEASTDTGTLPHTGLGFRGGLGLSAGYFQMEALMGYWPTVTTEVGASPPLGGSFSMLVADLRACVLADAGIVSLGPCAGAGITSMQAEGFGVTTPIAAGAEWGSLAADALVRVRLSRFFSPRLSAGLSVPLARPTFEVQGLGPVHQPAAVALQIGVGMELHF